MKAVGQSILFKYKAETTTESGIYISSGLDANSTSIKGEVISVGGLVQFVKVGDIVLIPKLMKTPVDLDEGIYTTLEHQVLAIIDG